MFIRLDTEVIWRFPGDFEPSAFIHGLPVLLEPGDMLVIGSYDPPPEAEAFLTKYHRRIRGRPVYRQFFDTNRDKHPNGRAFQIPFCVDLLPGLAELTELKNAGGAYSPFFDHVLAFRLPVPVTPLFSFHDAFFGGSLDVSDGYEAAKIAELSRVLGSTPIRTTQ